MCVCVCVCVWCVCVCVCSSHSCAYVQYGLVHTSNSIVFIFKKTYHVHVSLYTTGVQPLMVRQGGYVNT